MKNIIVTIVALGTLSATVGASQIRFWLSRSAFDPGYEIVPELSCEPGTQALYLWAAPEPDDTWIGISMFADFAPEDGCELVSPSEIFDQVILGVLPQWNPGSDLSFLGDHLAAAVAITEPGLGGPLDPPDDGNAYLIGQLTVHCTACEATKSTSTSASVHARMTQVSKLVMSFARASSATTRAGRALRRAERLCAHDR